MLRDRYSEVIPAISRVEESIIIPFELTRKENDETSLDVSLDLFQDLRYPRKAEKGPHANNSDNTIGGNLWLAERVPYSPCRKLGKFSL